MPLTWAEHPILKPPGDAEVARMNPGELLRVWESYHGAITNAKRDPYRYGYVFPSWEFADKQLEKFRTLLVLGANRASKTRYGAKAVVHACMENPEALVFCFSQNQETSVLVQQAAIYEYLPEELRRKATSEDHYISYSQKNGFTGNSLILPNRSQIIFKTYSQFQQNNSILEGMELGAVSPKWVNIGAWCDEYLLGLEMLDRLYLRLATRNAKLILTFTPKDGETETVRYYRDGATCVEKRPAPLMEELHHMAGYMTPSIEENPQKNTAIVYFFSKDNPWSGYESIVDICRSKDDPNYTLTAAYGFPTKGYSSKFPRFSRNINVRRHEDMARKDVTRYMVIDPAGAKNWFMAWIAVDATETWWVYREWPDVGYGDWARFSNGKWVEGEAAKTLGYGVKDYVDLIHRLEADDGEPPFERLIDPRLGQAKYQGENGQTSIIEALADHGVICIPAPGIDIEDGLQALASKMAYNPKLPIDAVNRPRFYISERCQQIITALQEYDATPMSEGQKDPVDVLRYAAVDGIRFIDQKAFKSKRTRRGGY